MDLLKVPFALCRMNPATQANGAMALWRHLDASHYTDLKPQRDLAASYGFESPTIVFVYFDTGSPGDNSIGQNNAAIAWLATQVALYAGEDIIAIWGNMNGDNFMTSSSPAVRNAAWWNLEGRAITEVFEPLGVRWAAANDLGTVSMAQTIVARRAAWSAAGADPDDCEFIGTHSYIQSGFVPSHILLAEESFARAGVTTPIRTTECAYGFLGVGYTRPDKPWLFEDWAIGTAHPQALTWTRLLFSWYRSTGRHMLIFDWTMLIETGGVGLSAWGNIFISDQHNQPSFVTPVAGTLWAANKAPTKAYQIRVSNGGTDAEGRAAAAWVRAGNFFTLSDSIPTATYNRVTVSADPRVTVGGDKRIVII